MPGAAGSPKGSAEQQCGVRAGSRCFTIYIVFLSCRLYLQMERLCCKQLPGVAILGTGGGEAVPKEYFAHAHQFVGLLKGNTDRRSSSKAFHAFLDSQAGSKLRENDGGDLLSAMHHHHHEVAGPLEKMMYTYRLQTNGSGSPSSFVTVAGMREIMDGLPNANIAVKNKLQEIFAEYLNQSSSSSSGSNTPLLLSFEQATPEQCAKDDADDDEGIEEMASLDTTMIVTQKMWYEVRLSSFETAAEKRVLEAQLQAKDYMIVANESVKAAEVAKERAEKELAQKELVSVKESAAKDTSRSQSCRCSWNWLRKRLSSGLSSRQLLLVWRGLILAKRFGV